jgi:hypothetical protein
MGEGAQVECYSGSRYGERPLRFLFADKRYLVKEVEESWRTPTALHFRVRTVDAESFELTYNERDDQWHILSLARRKKEYR